MSNEKGDRPPAAGFHYGYLILATLLALGSGALWAFSPGAEGIGPVAFFSSIGFMAILITAIARRW